MTRDGSTENAISLLQPLALWYSCAIQHMIAVSEVVEMNMLPVQMKYPVISLIRNATT